MFSLLAKKKPARRKAPRPDRKEERILPVHGRPIPLHIRQTERATRITLRIEPGGRALKMTIPHGLPEREVSAFLTRHHGWLEKKLFDFPDDARLSPGETVLVRGIPHRIEHSGKLRGLTETRLVDGEAVIRISGLEDHTGRRISDHLKKLARAELEQLVAVHTARIGKRHSALTLKDTRSRWGSCSSAGNLNFSWRIAMAPPEVINYLAAHEVAHLKEMNHGPKFWALCKMLCPDMEEAKAWLKRHGSTLHAIDFS
nr:M48 family metallopeptidase [uncultured Gellertiella sp.]